MVDTNGSYLAAIDVPWVSWGGHFFSARGNAGADPIRVHVRSSSYEEHVMEIHGTNIMRGIIVQDLYLKQIKGDRVPHED